jgi:hypothetical protein
LGFRFGKLLVVNAFTSAANPIINALAADLLCSAFYLRRFVRLLSIPEWHQWAS